VIAAVLGSVVRDCEDNEPTLFDAKRLPEVSILHYLRRWMRYTRCGAVCIVSAVILMDRTCKKQCIPVTAQNVHRFLLAALTVASKYSHDIPYLNSHYARVGGVPLQEVNLLERDLLRMLDFDVIIHKNELDTYVNMFQAHREWPVEEEAEVTSPATSSPGVRGPALPSPCCRRSACDDSETNGLSETRTSRASGSYTEGVLSETQTSGRSSVVLPAGPAMHAVRDRSSISSSSPRSTRSRRSLPWLGFKK